MDIKLDDEAVRQAVASSLIDQLGADGQRKLVEAALLYLTTPRKSASWERDPPSPIQEAFNNAVGDVARKLVRDLVAENEEFQARIKTQVGEAFVKMESTDFSDYLGTALSAALKAER